MSRKLWHSTKHFYINIEPFGVDVLFAINTTEKQTTNFLIKSADKNKIPKNLNKMFHDWDTSLTHKGRTISFAGGFIVLLKTDKKAFRYFVSVLTHEITHVIHYMLRDRRIPPTKTTEEIYTYHIQSLLYKALCTIY